MERIKEKQAIDMLEVLPPTTWYKTENGEVFQVGEAFDHNENGLPRFSTYERKGKQWFYRGLETKHKGKENIMESDSYTYL